MSGKLSGMTPEEQVRNNIWNFYLPIEMPGIWFFNHALTLKRIDLYYNGKFEKGEFDSQGWRKYFFNISKPACDVASKFVSLETKDIILKPDHSDDDQLLWLMQQDLRQWLRDNKFNVVMDEVKHDFPKYGSVIIKKDRTKNWTRCNLQNFRFDIAARTLNDSMFVYELELMTGRDINDMVYHANWDASAAKELYRRGREAKYLIYETYSYNDDTAGKKWTRRFHADLFTYAAGDNTLMRTVEVRINRPQDYIPSIILYEDEVDELPYRELHFERIPGRWLGLGFVEYLFDNQISRNESVNLKRKGLYWSALRTFQTKDQTVGANIMTEMDNGDILKVTSEVTPIDTQNKDLASFDSEHKDWDQNKIEKTFTTDLSRGENLPSRTPLGVANIQAGMMTSYFDEKRKVLGMFFRDLIIDDIIPRFKEEVAPEHRLMFAGSQVEMEKMMDAMALAHVSDAAISHMNKTGFFPSQDAFNQEIQRIKNELMKKKGLDFTIPASVYNNVKHKADILTTGEQIDTASTKQTLQTVMQIIGTNPAVMQDPAMRAIIFMMMELSGVNPVELDMLKTQVNTAQQQQQQTGGAPQLPAGGSIVVPKGISNPQMVPKKQIL